MCICVVAVISTNKYKLILETTKYIDVPTFCAKLGVVEALAPYVYLLSITVATLLIRGHFRACSFILTICMDKDSVVSF